MAMKSSRAKLIARELKYMNWNRNWNSSKSTSRTNRGKSKLCNRTIENSKKKWRGWL